MKTITDKALLHKLLIENQVENFFPDYCVSHLQLLLFDKGETLCTQGHALNHLYVTLTGSVKIMRRLADGKEHILETHRGSTLVGDIEFLTNELAVASVIMLEESYVVQLSLSQKERLLNDATFLYQLGNRLASNFYQQNIRTTTNISYSVKERLATYILEVADQDGNFTLDLSLLADVFGTSYRHMHRVLNQLVTIGCFERTAFKRYHILDKNKLVQFLIDDS